LAAGGGDLSLAGGGALIAHSLITRETKDLDAFTEAGDVEMDRLFGLVVRAFVAAGYSVTDTSKFPGAHRLEVARKLKRPVGRPLRPVEIELCTDFRALPSVPSQLGPLLDPLE
jgi:hypothetical protein